MITTAKYCMYMSVPASVYFADVAPASQRNVSWKSWFADEQLALYSSLGGKFIRYSSEPNYSRELFITFELGTEV